MLTKNFLASLKPDLKCFVPTFCVQYTIDAGIFTRQAESENSAIFDTFPCTGVLREAMMVTTLGHLSFY